MRFKVYQPASCVDECDENFGKWVVVTNYPKIECSSPMDEHDARLLCDCLNTLDKVNRVLDKDGEIAVNSEMHEDVCLVLYRTP